MSIKPIFPSCWDDDERMDYLFSAYPKDTVVNYKDSQTKYNFWSEVITNLCLQNKKLSINFEDIKLLVQRKEKTPLSLKVVWNKMIENKEFVSKVTFLKEYESSSWFAWTLDIVVKKPLEWLTEKINSSLQLSDKSEKNYNEQFICVKVLKKRSDQVLSLLCEESTNEALQIISFKKFVEKAKKVVDSDDGVNFIFLYLLKTRKIITNSDKQQESDEERFIKFLLPNQKTISHFTDIELSSIKLFSTKSAVFKEKELLTNEKDNLYKEIKLQLKQKNKQVALVLLKKVKKLEKSIESKENVLINIDDMLDRLQQSKTDIKVLESYKSANKALNNIMNNSGLTEAEEVMSSIEDAVDNQEEISKIMSSSFINFDEDELELELAELVEDKVVIPQIDLPDLPDIDSPEITNKNQNKNIDTSINLSIG